MAPRNVLVTTRVHQADPKWPKTNEPVLIDFGKGLDSVSWEQGNSFAISEDVKAYGELIEQLVIQWMEEVGLETIPVRLVNIIRQCKSEDMDQRPNSKKIVFLLEALERDIGYPDLATSAVTEMQIEDALNASNGSKRPVEARSRDNDSSIPIYRRF